MTAFVDKVVAVANAELATFQNGKLKEYDKDVYKRVGNYWDELAKNPDYVSWKGYNGRKGVSLVLDANDNVVKVKTDAAGNALNKNQPWSAAFISFVMAKAGAGDNFAYGPAHSVYIVKALKEAAKANSTAKFIARRRTDYAPKVGDLIACERRKFDTATFDTYIDFVKAEKYEAHCDVIVAIDGTGATTIGGNVSNSVKTKTWPLDNKGRIGKDDPTSTVASVICIIENKL